jgi:hypothetical protein
MSAKVIVIWGILGVLTAMAIVIFMPKACEIKTTEGFAVQRGNCVFNAKKYADLYPDLKKAVGYDEKKLRGHYIKHGLGEGRTPCGADLVGCKWSSKDYLEVYKDVANAGVDPLKHYKQNGIFEGRSVCPAVPERNSIRKCPSGSKSFIDKQGNLNCCSGSLSGNICDGKTICTFGNSTTVPHCSAI